MAEVAYSSEIEKENHLIKEIEKSPFSDAIYKELAKINGRINQMTKTAIIYKLKQFRLSTDGSCEILKKRLKNFYKKQKLTSANLLAVSKLYPYYVIVDFEATCEVVNPPDYPHEIIEYPAVLVDTEKQQIVDHFQAYCKPVLNPTLSAFCKELTGITQEQIDSAQSFSEVMTSFEVWLRRHQLGSKFKYAVVTDGPWDMSRFLLGQCKISNIPYPQFGKRWINIRKAYSSFYKSKRFSLRLMLHKLEIEFEGRPHCGLDDACNIARILLRMISDGANLQVNERIYLNPCVDKAQGKSRSGTSNQLEGTVMTIQNPEAKNFVRVCRERSIREHAKSKMVDDDDEEEDEEESNGTSDGVERENKGLNDKCEDANVKVSKERTTREQDTSKTSDEHEIDDSIEEIDKTLVKVCERISIREHGESKTSDENLNGSRE